MMLTRILTAAAISASLMLPSVAAFAQDSYYVIQDVKTKKCEIMDKQPTASEYTVVGPAGTVYHTRTEAESAMKTVKVCHTE